MYHNYPSLASSSSSFVFFFNVKFKSWLLEFQSLSDFEIHDLHGFPLISFPLWLYQVPIVPLQRPDEIHITSPSWMQTSSGCEEMAYEQGIPTMITWTYGGKDVAVEGSWDNWKTRFIEKKIVHLVFVLVSTFYSSFTTIA